MPGLFYKPIDRKAFLAATTRMAGVAALAQLSPSASLADATEDEAHVALLSDTHIPADPVNEYRGFRPVENLREIVPQVIASKPELAFINGDAARLKGFREDYEALKTLLTPLAAETPIHIGLGNHDDRRQFFGVFENDGDEPVGGKHVTVVERGPVRFLLLDSLLYVDKVAGLLGKSQRDWLAKFLDESDDRPHVLMVHHTLGDGDGDLLDANRMFEIIGKHQKVKAVFYGHSHRYSVDRRGHIQLINLPAVGYNFGDDQPVGWIDARFTRDGVSMKLNAIGGNRMGDGKTTTVTWS